MDLKPNILLGNIIIVILKHQIYKSTKFLNIFISFIIFMFIVKIKKNMQPIREKRKQSNGNAIY